MMEQTKTVISSTTIDSKKESDDRKSIDWIASSIRDGADLRQKLAEGVDSRVIDRLSESERGNSVMREYMDIRNRLGAEAERQSDGLYNEVLPNGDRRRKLTEVNPETGEVRNCMGYRTQTFSIPKLSQ